MTSSPFRRAVFVLTALAVLAVPAALRAAVTGELKTGSAGTMTISLSGIALSIDPSANPAGPPWNAEVANSTTLMFVGCPSGVPGTPGCLDFTPFTPAEAILIASVTSATTLPLSNFLAFSGNGVTHAPVTYTLTSVGPGSSSTNCAAATSVGASCSVVAGSPVILTKSSAGTTVTISFAGTATDGAGSSTWVGQLTGMIAGQSPAQLQLFYCPSGTCTAPDLTSGLSRSLSFSGDFKASPPP